MQATIGRQEKSGPWQIDPNRPKKPKIGGGVLKVRSDFEGLMLTPFVVCLLFVWLNQCSISLEDSD